MFDSLSKKEKMFHPIATKESDPNDSKVLILPPIKNPYDSVKAPKETILTLNDLNQIKKMAFHRADEDLRIQLHREKKELHSKSNQSVKNWGNTVMGQRHKRLLAVEEKAKAAEDERIRLDKEWADIQERERQEAIDRARRLQRLDSPRYKHLHSQLFLSSVLLERDMQVARKKKKKEQEIVPLVENDPFTQSAQEEANALDRGREGRLTIAEYQKCQIKSKQDQEAQQKKAHFDHYVNVNKKISEEIKAAKENDSKKTKEFKENWRKALQVVIEGKKAVLGQEKEESSHLDKANEQFLNRKSYIASKHREVIGNRYKAFEEVYDKISSMALDAEKAKEKEIEEFIKKGVESHLKDPDDRLERERAYREALVKNTGSYRQIQLDAAKKKEEQERKDIQLFKKQIDEQYAQHVAQLKAKAEKKARDDLYYKTLQSEQIKEKQMQAERAHHAARTEHKKDLLRMEDEKKAFEDYAQTVIQEWHDAGRDTNLMTRYIDRLQVRPRQEVFLNGVKMDTFERLGFSVKSFDEAKKH